MSDLSDLEITRPCAEAMGYSWPSDAVQWENYNPLHDDAQAMALVKKFELACYRYHGAWCAEKYGQYRDDPDLNRAICLCVAQLQRSRK